MYLNVIDLNKHYKFIKKNEYYWMGLDASL